MSSKRSWLLKYCAVAGVLLLTACIIAPPSSSPPSPLPKPASPLPSTTKPIHPPVCSSLRDYLKQQLGSNFHPRADWAGTGPDYAPRSTREHVWRAMGQVNYVTIHHAEVPSREDTVAMIRAIYRGHIYPKGAIAAADIGYHFLIDTRGQVWEGRDASITGTHVGSRPSGLNNPGNIGICGLGSFLQQDPPQVMVDRAVSLSVLLAQYYGHPMIVRGHRDWSGINGAPHGCTSCPGRLECAIGLANAKMVAAFPNGAMNGGRLLAGAAPQRANAQNIR